VNAPVPNYAHHAELVDVIDGDTFTLVVDRGRITLGVWDQQLWTCRLNGIDTWEVRGPDVERGVAARECTYTALDAASSVVVRTIHPERRRPELEKYGRVLVDVWADDTPLVELLRAGGHEKGAPPRG
jgi:endonuclease YncB( thermonuclease family)